MSGAEYQNYPGDRFGREGIAYRTSLRKRPDRDVWYSAMMTGDGEILLGTVRNYLGKIRTPYDKRTLVSRLESFFLRPETGEALVSLLDGLDIAILGTAWLAGPLPEEELKGFFLGELPLFELGLRIANLNDRLLLFRFQEGGKRLVALNPLIEQRLLPVILDPEYLLADSRPAETPAPDAGQSQAAEDPHGPASTPASGREGSVSGVQNVAQAWSPAMFAVALYCFLHHNPGWIRKDGGISKKGLEKLASAMPGAGTARIETMVNALATAGYLPLSDSGEGRRAGDSFESIVAEAGQELPFRLALSLADSWTENGVREDPQALSACLAASLRATGVGPQFVFSRQALGRWMAVCLYRSGFRTDSRKIVEALENLGLFVISGTGLRWEGSGIPERSETRKPVLVTEGTHALHLLPEAGLAERLFVGLVAKPVSLGRVWSFEAERSGFRRALGMGHSLASIRERLESLSGRALPQSLAFSFESWDKDFHSLRQYCGTVIVADERLRPILEHELILDSFIAEILAPGVYFLKAAAPEDLERALLKAGLEVPPVNEAPASDDAMSRRERRPGRGAGSSAVIEDGPGFGFALPSPRTGIQPGAAPGQTSQPAPGRMIARLKQSLAGLGAVKTESERREISDRIDRRLILTESQMLEADARSERQEAGGLDYQGKVRVVEKTLKSVGDRLEIMYRPAGDDAVCLMVRPVRLEKSEKGMVLEAEDLATGGPVRINLGAASAVRRVRASLFGEE